MSQILTSGDDFLLPVTLNRNGQPITLATEDKVLVALIIADTNAKQSKMILGPVPSVSDADGADWSAGQIVAVFHHESTESLGTYAGSAITLEVQVEAANLVTTWMIPGFALRRGLIKSL